VHGFEIERVYRKDKDYVRERGEGTSFLVGEKEREGF
jgi:hypothetical protein